MRIIAAYFRAEVRALARTPAYTVSTLVLPGLFFLMFGAPRAGRDAQVNFLATSFATFAVFGVVFFRFGVSTALERVSPWARYLRTLPLPPGIVLIAQSLSAALFALIAASIVFGTARLTTGAAPAAPQLLRIYAGLLGGAVPITLFGVALGYWTSPRSAVALANLIYLMLSYAGGLWVPPNALPPGIRAVSTFLPTYHWGRVVWPGVLGQPWRVGDWLVLVAWTLAFGAFALRGYRRDEGQRYD